MLKTVAVADEEYDSQHYRKKHLHGQLTPSSWPKTFFVEGLPLHHAVLLASVQMLNLAQFLQSLDGSFV